MRKKMLFGLVFCASLALCCFGLTKTTLAADWTDITGTMSGFEVSDLLQASDGSIYAGGNYNNGEEARVWKYSNGSWTDISSGITGSYLMTLVESSDGSIYAGGNYNNFHARVWKYSNNIWTDVTGDLDGYVVNSLTMVSDGSIYAGGNYTINGFDHYARAWKFSNGTWLDITDSNLIGYEVSSIIEASDGFLYAGGLYVDVEYNSFARIWKYSGNVWSDITGNLVGADVMSLIQTNDGTIYVGGDNVVGDNIVAKVWKYNNSVWQDMSVPIVGINSHIDQLTSLGNNIYASGYDDVTGAHTAKVWTYSNNVWSSDVLGQAANNVAAWTIALGSDGLYAGGFVNSVAKAWMRSYTTEEWRLIEENNLENGDEVTLIPESNTQTISGQDLILNFTKLPNKLTKNSAYWMQWQRFNAYPKKWKNVKKTALKRYWKLTTNLNKYKAKKSSQKFKIKVTFKYTKKLYNRLKKKNSLTSKSKLTLKYRNKTTSWKKVTSVFTDAKLVKKNKKMIVKYFTHFPKKTNYFAIGLK